MSELQGKRPLFIIIAAFFVCACIGFVGILVGVALFVTEFASFVGTGVGSSFSTAEALAYDIIYETQYPDVDPTTIHAVQEQQIDSDLLLHAVLMQYQLTDKPEPQYQLIMARDNGRELFYENADIGPFSEDENLSAYTLIHANMLDSDVVVYGVLRNPEITQVVITWPNGWEDEAAIEADTFLWFQSWSPVDGSPEPAKVTAYTADGTAVSILSLTK